MARGECACVYVYKTCIYIVKPRIQKQGREYNNDSKKKEAENRAVHDDGEDRAEFQQRRGKNERFPGVVRELIARCHLDDMSLRHRKKVERERDVGALARVQRRRSPAATRHKLRVVPSDDTFPSYFSFSLSVLRLRGRGY